jgi:[glutamine synthetase] adenylyltransferase / [glutamine synthetase]-adenylyl-L-tyrosine phosphorylase
VSTVEEVARALPEGGVAAAALHLGRLPARYAECFAPGEIASHIRLLAELGPDAPLRLVVRPTDGGGTECTVLAFDHRALFSLLCGVLSSLGMDVASGEAFTTSGSGLAAKPRRRVHAPAPAVPVPGRRRIIDRFTGAVRSSLDPSRWQERVQAELEAILRLLERGEEEAALAARGRVNDMVAAALVTYEVDVTRALYPVTIGVDNERDQVTVMDVVSEDTPFFLYAFSTALALRGLRIEQVRIRTEGRSIRDQFGIVDRQGNKIRDPDTLEQVRLSALLTKQFSYFLANAPDPTAALGRFEDLVERALPLGDRERWVRSLSDPRALENLARLLGASDYLWEDFVRGQYEALMPILAGRGGRRSAFEPAASLDEGVREALASAEGYEGKVEALNRWKDARVFACDLDHILDPSIDHAELGRRLTRLAECVVRSASGLAAAMLSERHGVPRTVAGIEVPWAVMGLGKLGSEALGYASDIELLVVYQDAGATDGGEPLENGEYFGRLARELAAVIRAKREGIFSVDLRLRPYGSSGQAAASLESYCRYYGRGGEAHSYERLALVAMRAIAGDPDFGARLERLRDEMVYVSGAIDLEELRDLRARQVREKDALARPNAKFSPGALVDLEYTVQILQVTHGATHAALRTPRIREALSGLARAGALGEAEAELLGGAYGFLRGLINALRMLRGSALDLALPLPGSEEYVHLARRMGWRPDAGVTALDGRRGSLAGTGPARQLHLEFEAQTAEVRSFMQRHFGSSALLAGEAGSMADLVLSESVPAALGDRVLRSAGFRDAGRALRNLRALAGEGAARQLYARVAVLAADMLPRMPDADMALNNWERYMRAAGDREEAYARLLRQPTRLDILLSVFASSQYLSDTLASSPDVFERIAEPLAAGRVRTSADILLDIDALGVDPGDLSRRAAALRLVKRRELARIGIKDICLGSRLEEVCFELSELADALVTRALDWVTAAGRSPERLPLLLLAFGKLGGRELNYSSDIDLVGVLEPGTALPAAPSGELEELRRELGELTADGYVYRVDFRLRPYGASGELVSSASALVRYYESAASLWELQAALKARAVAGGPGEGIVRSLRRIIVERVADVLSRPGGRSTVAAGLRHMRSVAARAGGRLSRHGADVKNGPGGIRDVEFAVQMVQLLGCAAHPELLEGGTLAALDLASRAGALDGERAASLGTSYVFLRKVEHYLQLFDDRQTHTLPAEGWRMDHLARCLLGPEATAASFMARLDEVRRTVSAEVERVLGPV